MDKRIINAIAITSLTLWAISFVLDAVIRTYDPPASIHIIMMTVAGAAFGGTIFKKDPKEKEESK